MENPRRRNPLGIFLCPNDTIIPRQQLSANGANLYQPGASEASPQENRSFPVKG